MRIIRYLSASGDTRHAALDPAGKAFELDGELYAAPVMSDRPAAVARLLAPVIPTQILCIGLNYRRHAQETGAKIPEYPVMFAKGINSLQHPGSPIEIPTHLASTEVDYECELAVVIGRDCKNVRVEDALDFVLGYTAANDVSARDWQIARGGGQWCRGKFFDTFCPLGPALVTRDEIPDPNALTIRTVLNGQTVQDWNTNDMIFPVRELISFLSGSCTLPAGTVILTGTPHGVGMAAKPPRWLRPGDTVSVEIERIGTLTNPVELEGTHGVVGARP
jgi:2-keto-4-pentenoate hydratase/2-oxohepta-3-ene-1,7-dioic acid hydratase in catechol pathway